jgi:hypothetical protein
MGCSVFVFSIFRERSNAECLRVMQFIYHLLMAYHLIIIMPSHFTPNASPASQLFSLLPNGVNNQNKVKKRSQIHPRIFAMS